MNLSVNKYCQMHIEVDLEKSTCYDLKRMSL